MKKGWEKAEKRAAVLDAIELAHFLKLLWERATRDNLVSVYRRYRSQFRLVPEDNSQLILITLVTISVQYRG